MGTGSRNINVKKGSLEELIFEKVSMAELDGLIKGGNVIPINESEAREKAYSVVVSLTN